MDGCIPKINGITKFRQTVLQRYGDTDTAKEIVSVAQSSKFLESFKTSKGYDFDENGDMRIMVSAVLAYLSNKRVNVDKTTYVRISHDGFSSVNARELAIRYTGRVLNRLNYLGAITIGKDGKPKSAKLNSKSAYKTYAKGELRKIAKKAIESIKSRNADNKTLNNILKDSEIETLETTLDKAKKYLSDYLSKYKTELEVLKKEIAELKKVDRTQFTKEEKQAHKEKFNALVAKKNKLIKDKKLTVDDYSDIINRTSKDLLEEEIRVWEIVVNHPTLRTVQELNQVMMYKNIFDDDSSFYNTAVNLSTVSSWYGKLGEKDEIVEDYSAEVDAERVQTGEEHIVKEADETDSTTTGWNGHLGTYISFLKHADSWIRSYINSIPKIVSLEKNSDGTYAEDVNNELGLGETLNDKEVVSLILSSVNKNNAQTIIDSLKNIARDIPEYRSLQIIAEELENNFDLRYAFYCNFGKTAFSKSEVAVVDGEAVVRSSNPYVDRSNAFRMYSLNSLKLTALEHNQDILLDRIKAIGKLLDTNKKELETGSLSDTAKSARDNIEIQLRELLSVVLPNVSFGTVNSYLHKEHNLESFYKNANTLLGNLQALINTFEDIQTENGQRLASINAKFRDIYNIREEINTLETLPRSEAQIEELRKQETKLLSDIAKLREQDYLSKVQSTLFSLTDELLDYTIVKTELNSRNAEGNLSSDVLNNNMLTSIINMLQSDVALSNFGKFRFRSRQYDLSNIMIEHKDKDGRIINRGLFYVDEKGNKVPTPYAKRLLQVTMFNGITNTTNGTSASYASMYKGDYIATGLIEYQNATIEHIGNDAIEFANYFTRIPSDAPKTFVIRAPKYSTQGLIATVNGVRGYDINHPVFQQMRQIFQQELNDAANALYEIFETVEAEDGSRVIRFDEKGKPIVKLEYQGDGVKQLFQVYHTSKGKILSESGENYKLLGRVFTSDRFVVGDETKTDAHTNFGQELFNEINFLYGWADGKYKLIVDDNGDATIKLNEELDNKVNDQIKKFITALTKDAIARTKPYESFIEPKYRTNEAIMDFVINNYLAYISFNDILEGDTKFYKDAQDFLKRAKEIQAAGIPYGIVDYLQPFEQSLEHIDSSLDGKGFMVSDGKGGKRLVRLRRGFTGVTIKNTIRRSEDSKRLIGWYDNPDGKTEEEKGEWHDGNLVKNKVVTKEAAQRLSELYEGVKTNDAQSYITLEEWIRRITARGLLPRYEHLINKLLDENAEITASDLEAFVQVQKNFYYDINFSNKLRLCNPRQIKNAEFVLIPRFIKGTDLEVVHELMAELGIDQLNTAETSKAGKVNILELWNNDGVMTEKAVAQFREDIKHNSDSIERFSYNNLYTQQDTPQHMDANNKAAIQIMKKILDNIDKNSKLYSVKVAFMDAYSANIRESFDTLLDTLGIPRDKNGNIDITTDDEGNIRISGMQLDKIYERLEEELNRLGTDSNTAEFAKLDTHGLPMLSPVLSNVSTKLENVLQGIVNSVVTRQKLPGFHAAQVTDVGMHNTYRRKDGTIKKDSSLRYHPVVDGKQQHYAEVKIAKPKFLEKFSDEEALKMMQKAGIDMMIGYRIPTEGKQSVAVMKVVGFLDAAQGSTIVVPDDWVAQTGSDFDIDSVYGIQYSADLVQNPDTKEWSIEVKKGMSNRIERNNTIVDSMITILSDDESIEQNLTASSFKDIIRARDAIVNILVKAKRANRSPYNFYDQADYFEDAMSGARLKGMSVMRDTFLSVCNTVKPTMEMPVKIAYRKENGLSLETIKEAYDADSTSDGKIIVKHNQIGWSKNNRNVRGRYITIYSSETTAHILDAIKEGAIPNVNDLTFAVYKLFPDIGSDYETAISFIMQNGITRINTKYAESKSVYIDDNNTYYVQQVIKDIARELGLTTNNKTITDYTKIDDVIGVLQDHFADKFKKLFGDDAVISTDNRDIQNLVFDYDVYKRAIDNSSSPVEGITDKEYKLLNDLHTVLQYKYLSDISREINDHAQVLNPDKFGAKVTTFSTRKAIEDICKLKEKSTLFSTDKGSLLDAIYPGLQFDDNERPDLVSYLNNNDESSYKTLNSFLKYASVTSVLLQQEVFSTELPSFVKAVNRVAAFLNTTMTEELYNSYKKYLLGYIYRNVEFKQWDGENRAITDDDISRILGINRSSEISFAPEDLNNLTDEEKQQWLELSPAQKVLWIKQNSDNAGIFAFLDVNYRTRKNSLPTQVITFNNDAVDIETALYEAKKAWRNSSFVVKETMRDLFKYSVIAEDFEMTQRGVMRIIPNSLISDVNFSSAVAQAVSMFGEQGTDNIVIDFIRSNPDNKSITRVSEKKFGEQSRSLHDNGLVEILVDSSGKVPKFARSRVIRVGDILYCVSDNGKYAYPLHKLERFEHTTDDNPWSINESYNETFPSRFYFESVISYMNDDGFVINALDYKYKTQAKHIEPSNFDINELSTSPLDGYGVVIQKIRDNAALLGKNKSIVFRNKALTKHLFNVAGKNITVQTIDGINYTIVRVKPGVINKYLRDKNRKIDNRDSDYADLIKEAREYVSDGKDVSLDDIFMAYRTPERMNYTVEDLADNFTTEMSREASRGDETFRRSVNSLRRSGVNTNNRASIEANVPRIISATRQSVETRVQELIESAEKFYKDEDNVWHSINDPVAMKEINRNAELMNKFVNIVNEASAITTNFNHIDRDGLNINAQSPALQSDLNAIRATLANLSTNPLFTEAVKLFIDDVVGGLSDDPLVQMGLISVTEGFNTIGTVESVFTDAQEAPIPIMQIILKQVMSKVRGEEIRGTRYAILYKTKAESIIAKATSDGRSFNWSHIIDKNGRFLRDYIDKLREDLQSKIDELDRLKEEKGEHSREYATAKIAYDKWKNKYFNQPLVKEYYDKLIEAEEKFLTEFPDVYEAYKKLTIERREKMKFAVNGVLEDSKKAELDEINKKINRLTSTFGKQSISEIIEERLAPLDLTNPDDVKLLLGTIDAANAIKDYQTTISQIKNDYFDKSPLAGFYDTLEEHLKTMRELEAYGYTARQLENNQAYQDARAWVRNNANFVLNAEIKAKLDNAFKTLSRDKTTGVKLLTQLARDFDLYDEYHVIDGTKLTDAQIQQVKENLINEFGMAHNAFDDTQLITNSEATPFIWNSSFWNKFRTPGSSNSAYMRIVSDINKILTKCYDRETGKVRTFELSIDELDRLRELYYSLYETKRMLRTKEDSTRVAKALDESADIVRHNAEFDADRNEARRKGATYEKAWLEAMYIWEEVSVPDGRGGFEKIEQRMPNRFLYSTIRPKGAVGTITRDATTGELQITGNDIFMRYIDADKTKALDTINHYTRSVPTSYYYRKLDEVLTKRTKPDGTLETDEEVRERYRNWFAENHYWNTRTHTMEALPCWTTTDYRDGDLRLARVSSSSSNYNYAPKFHQLQNVPKEESVNSEWKDNGLLANYKPDATRDPSDEKYDRVDEATEEEKEMRELMERTLESLAKNTTTKDFVEKGFVPAIAKPSVRNLKWFTKEALKGVGLYYDSTFSSNWDGEVGYENDYIPLAPGFAQLADKTKMKYESIPKQQDGESKEDYEARVKEVKERNKAVTEYNKKLHESLLSNDWIETMKLTIERMYHYNAVQENKNLLYFGLNYLKNHKVYKTNFGVNTLSKDKRASREDKTVYRTEDYSDSALDVYKTFINRLVFDKYKKNNGWVTKAANMLQAMSSAKYMMLNITGGIANVTYGENQIWMEVFANEFFNTKDWAIGKALWLQSSVSFLTDLYSEKATSLGNGLIKLFETLEFDAVTGGYHMEDLHSKIATRARNAAYVLQTGGEHFMQNGALLTMLVSHRLVELEDKLGKKKWKAMTEEQYVRQARIEAIESIIQDDETLKAVWNSYKDSILSDDNERKEYAWRRKDPITVFVTRHLLHSNKKEIAEKFIKAEKKLKKDKAEEFKTKSRLYDQFELKDGFANFKDGSLLKNLGDDYAFEILGEFRNKVIMVNKKIHGVYDKLGAARIEKEWYGGVVMQYHKHLWPGIMKRFRRKGYYNEQRSTIEKGCYISLIDFLSTPVENMKDFSDNEKGVLKGIQNYFKSLIDFVVHANTYWNVLPDYEKANIRRCFADALGFLSAIALTIAFKLGWDDKEKKTSIAYNTAIYLADRLATESQMYTPWGLIGESKTLWSSPVASMTGINDTVKILGELSKLIIEGDEYDPNYVSGRFAGENKIKVLSLRQIPIYRSINQVYHLPKNNSYYKRQSNWSQKIADNIIEWYK